VAIKDYARMVDNVMLDDGVGQIFGTVFVEDAVDGRVKPKLPIADIAHTDERRAAIGLRPFAEDVAGMPTDDWSTRARRARNGNKRKQT
jgi:hypothetical protein